MTRGPSPAAEWARHRATWLAWPSDSALWGRHLEPAREEFVQLCRAIATGERLEILVRGDAEAADVRARLAGLEPGCHRAVYWDIWLRDTGPLLAPDAAGRNTAFCFRFNGWGERYHFAEDDGVAATVAELAGAVPRELSLVCEGGALDFDGEGACLTTATCLLNSNRNPEATRAGVEALLATQLAVDHVLWLEGQLAGDHTDGHVDTLARWLRPGVVACMEALAPDDPNGGTLERIARQLSQSRDREGRPLDLVRVPSPGLLRDDDGCPMPASYLNFYVANAAVVVPVYGSAYDEAALETLAAQFSDRPVLGLPARHILTGGGAFHCITQQEPEARGGQS